jgi:hypothetical protein
VIFSFCVRDVKQRKRANKTTADETRNCLIPSIDVRFVIQVTYSLHAKYSVCGSAADHLVTIVAALLIK